MTSKIVRSNVPRSSRFDLAILTGSAVALLTMAVHSEGAAISYGTAGGVYTQDFNGLPSTGSFTLTGNGPIDLSASPISATNIDGWSFQNYAGTGTAAKFTVETGSGTSGSVFSYGSAASTDRALGSLSSAAVISEFGLSLTNTTGSTLTTFTLSYTGEEWHNSTGGANTLSFNYSVGATAGFGGTLNGASGLNFTAPVHTAAAAVDGNAAANRQAITATITIAGSGWAPGQVLNLVWKDVDDPGSDQGLAIDDLSFSAVALAIRNLTWNATGGTGIWDGATANFAGDSTTFADGDKVTFGDGHQGIVTIKAGGVAPSSTLVNNTSGTYTFANTDGDFTGLSGSGGLTKTGAGKLVLSGINSYTGNTLINQGILQVNDDGNLGLGGALSFDGGTLQLGADGTPIIRSVVINAGGAFVDTNGFNGSLQGSLTGTGGFTKLGVGTLNITSTAQYTGLTAILGGALRISAGTGTSNMKVDPAGGTFVGDFIMATGFNANFNSGTISGGGKIKTESGSPVIANNGAGTVVTIANAIELGVGTVAATFGAGTGDTLNLNAPISGPSAVQFAALFGGGGTGLVNLNAQNTYTGVTRMRQATTGVVRLGIDNALPPSTSLLFGTEVVTSDAANIGAFDLNGHNQSIVALSSITSGTVNGIANTGGTLSTLTITGDQTTTYKGAIGIPADVTNLAGANSNIALVLSPTHTGTLTLTGTSNYSGGTTINSGKLVVNGAITGLVDVNSGGILGGAGTVGDIHLHDGAALTPGDGVGTLTASAFTWDGGSTLFFDLGTANASDTLTLGTGVLTKGLLGQFLFDFGGTGEQGDTYTLLHFGSLAPASTFSVSDFSYNNLASGLTGNFVLTSTDLTFVMVPEPSALLSGLIGAGAILGLRRRRHS